MITPESIVVSLDQAKRLKEAGWPQDSVLGYWLDKRYDTFTLSWLWQNWQKHGKTYAAPTAQEILQSLPKDVKDGYYIDIYFCGKDGWAVEYTEPHDGGRTLVDLADPSLANAAAAMYCYLSDNNLLP